MAGKIKKRLTKYPLVFYKIWEIILRSFLIFRTAKLLCRNLYRSKSASAVRRKYKSLLM